MMEEDKNVLVCGFENRISGSVRKTCGKCGRMVWASPASLKAVGEGEVICVECVQGLPLGSKVEFTRVQKEEMEKVIGRRVTDAEVDDLKVRAKAFLSSKSN